MNATLKNILIISAKQAVNVLIVNSSAWWADPSTFNFSNAAGWIHMLKLAASLIISREVIVWGPKILAWSESNGGPE